MTKRTKKVSPEAALRFLEDFRRLKSHQDETTQSISLRVPKNILRSFKVRARLENRPYQRMMVDALREFLLKADEDQKIDD